MGDGYMEEHGNGQLESNTGTLSVEADYSARLSQLLQKCRLLLSELEEFQIYIAERRVSSAVEMRLFTGNVKSELKLLEKVNARPRPI